MIRQIHTGALAAEPVAETAPPVAASAPAAAAQAAPGAGVRDALAGALPAWDLQPATPFVRRVK